MSDNREIEAVKALFADAKVPLSADDVWKVQGTPVVKHKALERLSAALKISFGAPVFLRNERDEAVLIVTGTLGDVSEWSVGEACIGLNYRVSGNQSGYPYAMAEKRGKDRVIIKLAKLQGVYSEEEADAFKQQATAEYAPPAERSKPDEPMATHAQLNEIAINLARTGRSAIRLLKHYGAKEPKNLTAAQADDALAILKAAPDAKDLINKLRTGAAA